MGDGVDQTARDSARDAVHDIRNFRAVADGEFRLIHNKIETTHKETNEKIDNLTSILKWAGGLIVMLFISTLTWSLAQQYNANESTKKDLQAQVELLREQQRNSVAARVDRQEILNRLPTGGTQPADTAPAGGQ